jgi:hypothetical protein
MWLREGITVSGRTATTPGNVRVPPRLFGSTIGLAVAVAFDHELALSLVAGGAVALFALIALMRFQRAAWMRAAAEPVSFEESAA